MFKFIETKIKGVFLIEPQVFADSRGDFMETYNEKEFQAVGLNYRFVQDNQNSSMKGVLRGLHFQTIHQQAKLGRALLGEVFDVAVDLRRGSPTYGQWVGEVLSQENGKMLMIPRGFAHGVLALSDTAIFAYKCDDFFHPEEDDGIRWDDPTIGITWPDVKIILSEKDQKRKTLKEHPVELEAFL